MIALLALAALISAFLIASALSLTSAGVSNEREDRSMSALRKAKAALIAYAANEQWQLYRALPSVPPAAYFQPGALPCPDQDDDGDADCFGSNTASMIGRLPFKTLGIDDLRDASGERLWYALSHDFRKLRCSVPPAPPITGCTTINSETLGQLTVTGMAPATQVVAIVFAPGAALDLRAVGGPQQDRTSIAEHNDYTNYLENVNLGDNIHFTFTSTGLPTPTSNDRLLAITQADLIAAVEPVVAANIARDVKPLVQDYFTKWGAYPFAMTGGSGTEIVTSWNCSVYSSPLQAVCHVSYTDGASPPDPSQARPDIKIQIFLQNANTAFADLPSPLTAPAFFTIDKDGGGPVSNQGLPYGQFSAVGSVAPTTTFVTQTAVVAETGVLVYTGRLQNAASMSGGVTITIPLATPKYLPIVSGDPAVNPKGSWFISNQWYRQAYYAVSQGYVSGGVPVGNPATCSPLPATPSCLTVNNLPAPKNNKSAILVLTGRALGSQTRPSGNPADYLEGQNSTPADLIFEHRAGTATTINDRVVVVSP
ncbi:MAG: hypothetical protein E6H49_18590 [Betaproteobacteria bacterium]|nr:MAG: hypothetical protein E6H49_18590 [Betaproteobacteria bacterium]